MPKLYGGGKPEYWPQYRAVNGGCSSFSGHGLWVNVSDSLYGVLPSRLYFIFKVFSGQIKLLIFEVSWLAELS